MLSILNTGSESNNNHMNNSDDSGTYECFHHDSDGNFGGGDGGDGGF